MVDKVSKEIRKKNMKAIHSKNTKMEIAVAKELWRRGYRFRKNVKDLPGKPDIAIKKYKVAIFLDSCFWHFCYLHGRIPDTNTDFWRKKFNYNKNHDQKINQYYINNGWTILRIWEHQVKDNFFSVIESIILIIDKAKNN